MPSTTTASSSTSSEDKAGSFVGTELPSIVKEQLRNRYIGTAILELADRRNPYYPDYNVCSVI